MYNKNNSRNNITTQITVTAAECNGNVEKMIRRFSKKVKKDGIIEEYRDRTHYVKPTTRRAEQKRLRRRLIEKVNKKREELFNFKGTLKRRSKR
tara:strand:+ start:140 stop:421 length:282 start_codon:yes stop_codon:yes gene_type:complete